MRSLIALGVVLAVTVAGLIALALFLGSLGSDSPDEDTIEREPLTIVTADGDIHRLQVEIAETPEERSRGLSGRETIPDGTGMIFINPSQATGFWMKDTPMPLDLVFVGEDGRIRDILPGEPFSTAGISPGEPVRFVLELKRGSATAAGIGKGDILRHPAIDRAAGDVGSPGGVKAPAGG